MNRGPMRVVDNKSKDFFGSIKRLIKELKNYKLIIIIALVLAIISSIFSIIAPSKLSDLTDEIAQVLVVKKDKLEEINNTIMKNNNSLNSFKIDNIEITVEDQMNYLKIVSSIDKNSSINELYKKIDELPESIQKVIKPGINWNIILGIVIFLVTIYVLSALFTYFESIIMTVVSNRFAKKLRSNISTKINKLPLKYFDNNQIGDILSRVTNDVDTIAQTLNQSLATLVSAITLFV